MLNRISEIATDITSSAANVGTYIALNNGEYFSNYKILFFRFGYYDQTQAWGCIPVYYFQYKRSNQIKDSLNNQKASFIYNDDNHLTISVSDNRWKMTFWAM